MKQEFVTTTGIAVIENNTLYIRRKTGSNYKTLFRIVVSLLFIYRVLLEIEKEPSPKRSIGIFVYSVATLIWLAPLIYDLLTKTLSNRILLTKIESYKIEEDVNGLEVHLILQLSFRKKIITFRKLENQLEPFAATLQANQIIMEPA